MDHCYREMRREHGFLQEGNQPTGGKWNYDLANRKRLPAQMQLPARQRFVPDATTLEVMAMVEQRFGCHFGTLEDFDWAVTRKDALLALDDCISNALVSFGDYHDAMSAGAPFLVYSLLSSALNTGLLAPRKVCQAAEAAWRSGAAPLHAVEGFIR